MLSFDIHLGFKRLFHSQPQTAPPDNAPVVPSSPIAWSVTPATGVVTLDPAPGEAEYCIISSVALGSSNVTVSQGGITQTVTVNVIPVPLDHFAMVADTETLI